MRKIILMIVVMVFAITGMVMAQEAEKTKVDWGFSIGIGTGSLATDSDPTAGYGGFEAGITAQYKKFLLEGSFEHYSKDSESYATSWESFSLKANYFPLDWAYLGINYAFRPGRTEYDYGYTAKATLNGFGCQFGVKIWKGFALELKHSSFTIKQDHFEDSDGEINLVVVKYFF